jgi:putative phage-type endonuclease
VKIIDVVQGTPEWHASKCGVPSASNFDKIVTTKGEPSKQREKYLYQLAGERIIGKAEETYQNGAMFRGIEMEAEARLLYELRTSETVQQVGFCVTEGKHIFGASPDGVIGEDGLLEIKCPLLSTHVSYLLGGCLPVEYFQQVQGQLLVTGRKWLDFVSYYPGIKPHVYRVKPDKKFMEALEYELNGFCVELEVITKKLKEKA